MSKIKIVAAVLGITALLGVSACGGGEPSGGVAREQDGGQAPSTDPSSGNGRDEDVYEDADEDAKVKAKDAGELAGNVEIVTCNDAAPIGVSATVEVTNSLDEPMEYIGTINFLDPEGTVLAEGVFNTGTLAPGQTGTEEVPGMNIYEQVPEYTCELVELKIDQPV
jgi:hypothetical protein